MDLELFGSPRVFGRDSYVWSFLFRVLSGDGSHDNVAAAAEEMCSAQMEGLGLIGASVEVGHAGSSTRSAMRSSGVLRSSFGKLARASLVSLRAADPQSQWPHSPVPVPLHGEYPTILTAA